MEFLLTYEGRLLSTGNPTGPAATSKNTEHVHTIRKVFHKQLRAFWGLNKVLMDVKEDPFFEIFTNDGFKWRPIATSRNKILCSLDILMLRPGDPGNVRFDIDNRLKTVFDALRLAGQPQELLKKDATSQTPDGDENPFYVLLQDDSLITHLSVTTGTLLEPVGNTPFDQSVRLTIAVKLRPNGGFLETLGFA